MLIYCPVYRIIKVYVLPQIIVQKKFTTTMFQEGTIIIAQLPIKRTHISRTYIFRRGYLTLSRNPDKIPIPFLLLITSTFLFQHLDNRIRPIVRAERPSNILYFSRNLSLFCDISLQHCCTCATRAIFATFYYVVLLKCKNEAGVEFPATNSNNNLQREFFKLVSVLSFIVRSFRKRLFIK